MDKKNTLWIIFAKIKLDTCYLTSNMILIT